MLVSFVGCSGVFPVSKLSLMNKELSVMTAMMMEKAPQVSEAELVSMSTMMSEAIDQVQSMEDASKSRVPRAANLLAQTIAQEGPQKQKSAQTPEERAAERRAERIADRVALREKEKQARHDWKAASRALKAKRAEEQDLLRERNGKAEQRKAERIASRVAIREKERQSKQDSKAAARKFKEPTASAEDAVDRSMANDTVTGKAPENAVAENAAAEMAAAAKAAAAAKKGAEEVLERAEAKAEAIAEGKAKAKAKAKAEAKAEAEVTATQATKKEAHADPSVPEAWVQNTTASANASSPLTVNSPPLRTNAAAPVLAKDAETSSVVIKRRMNVTKLRFKKSMIPAEDMNVTKLTFHEPSAAKKAAAEMMTAAKAATAARQGAEEVLARAEAKAGRNGTHPVHNYIPSLLSFTYKCDLLVGNQTCSHSTYDETLLRHNVWNTIHMHGGESCSQIADDCPASSCLECESNVTVRFYDDDACARVIGDVAPEPLLSHFHNESEGVHKAEICRAAILQRDGGIYFDADLRARMDVRTLIAPDSTFVGVRSPNSTFFKAFMAAAPRSEVINRYLDHLVAWFDRRNAATSSVGLSAMPKMPLPVVWQRAVSDEAGLLKGNAQLFREVPRSELDEAHLQAVPSQADDSCDIVILDEATGQVPFYSRATGSGPAKCTTDRHVSTYWPITDRRSEQDVADSLLGQ